HHLPLFLRRRSLNIEPIVLQPTEIPTWIQLIGVPVPFCTHLGVGHLVTVAGIIHDVEVVYPESRGYAAKQDKPGGEKTKAKTVWQHIVVPEAGLVPEAAQMSDDGKSLPEKDLPDTSKEGSKSLSLANSPVLVMEDAKKEVSD
ncbi:hypothetical protein LINPERHAP1_LOCUS8152, partial [Linum perenne]